MSVYESLVRPALFTLPPDLTHTIGHMALRHASLAHVRSRRGI